MPLICFQLLLLLTAVVAAVVALLLALADLNIDVFDVVVVVVQLNIWFTIVAAEDKVEFRLCFSFLFPYFMLLIVVDFIERNVYTVCCCRCNWL